EPIEAPAPHTVVFRLKRPQPSLLLLLASGYSPIYPAHVPLADLKTTCVGTGPFKLKEYRPGEFVEYVKNPDYFVKGRPYLDGVKWIHIKDRSTQIAALQAGQLDVGGSGWNKANAETAQKGKPEQIETGVWHPKMTRLDFQVALNLTGTAVDDPDAMLFENFRCGSQRNFSGYCSEEIDRLMVEQSQTLDRARRLKLVNEIDRRLQ